MKLKALLIIVLSFFIQHYAPAYAGSIEDLKSFRPERFEILSSDSSASSFESLFGHTSLLIIPENGSWQEGIVFSFVANTEKESLGYKYYIKGFAGGFQLIVSAESALTFFNNNIAREGRSITRTPIPLSQEQKINLWDKLVEYNRSPESLGSYYFHLKNCASMLLYALKESGVQINYNQVIARSAFSGVSPKKIVFDSRSALITPYSDTTIVSLRGLLNEIEKRFSIKVESVLDDDKKTFKPWLESDLKKFAKMSVKELVLSAQGIHVLDEVRLPALQKIIRDRKQRVTINAINFKEYPLSFYNVCEDKDSACLERNVADFKSFYSEKDFKNMVFRNYSEQVRASKLFQPEVDLNTSIQALNWVKLTNALLREIPGIK